jgi:TRAP-type uncharacterized transport system fused permease subunit
VTGSQIAIICALIGVVATCIKVSGLGIKLPLMIEDISGGLVMVALLIAMISSILLGMGVPTAAAYMLVAIGAVPALLNMGVPLLAAHMFCFIFASFSHITPPVAIGALVAARMAKADYWKTNWEALKAAFVAFLLPYFIVFVPLVTLKPESGWMSIVMKALSILVMVIISQMAFVGYGFNSMNPLQRGVFFCVAALSAIFLFTNQVAFFWLGLAGCLGVLTWHYLSSRSGEPLGATLSGD